MSRERPRESGLPPQQNRSLGRVPSAHTPRIAKHTQKRRQPGLFRHASSGKCQDFLEATPGIEPGYADLQSAASPLRHVASRRRVLSQRHAICKMPGFQTVILP